ncbi:MAG: response regulator transcription factor [Chloroflexota bacterium]|nr:response regulator transcription factor [Chloroflexota bacterium]
MSYNKAIRILLVDNQALVRQSLRMQLSLEPDLVVLVVMGKATDGDSAIKVAATLKPDVTVMDVDMSLMNGISATQHICQNEPNSKIVVLTMYADPVTEHNAIAAGAVDVIEKQPSPVMLVQAMCSAYISACTQAITI